MRDKILIEIRRIAEKSGGQPPGRMTFERETGIRETAWRGIYWARWSDAITEAGLEPNLAPAKFEANFFLGKIASACRHYGKIPTFAELRLYAKIDGEFPSKTTFGNHFRSKEQMLSQLSDWLERNSDFSDVAAMMPQSTASGSNSNGMSDGYVYLIQSGNHYKIGRSDDIERRMKEIRIALPDTAKMVHNIRTDDPAGIEAYWHRRFAEKRANGEWFKLAAADIAAFKKRKYQ
jgi:hypothetical protein